MKQLQRLVVPSTVQVGQPKVGNLDIPGTIEEDVFWFQIAVTNSLGMAVLHPLQKLPEVEPRLILGESLSVTMVVRRYVHQTQAVDTKNIQVESVSLTHG